MRRLHLLALAAAAGCGTGTTAPAGDPAPAVNRPPVFGAAVTTADHNRPYAYPVRATDPESAAVTVTLVNAPAWLALDPATATVGGLAGWDNIGDAIVHLRASDGDTSADQRFILAVRRGEIVCAQDFGDPGASAYALPYGIGRTYTLFQGYCPPNPTWGHHNWFAYDFDMAIGDTVRATRGGVVLFAREHFLDGNRRPGDENFVFIEHADGTVMHYMHLTTNGALVEPGDTVTQGQPIGLSGDTGGSTGPHLHIALFRNRSNFDRQSTLPINFVNAQGPLDANRGLVQGASYAALPY